MSSAGVVRGAVVIPAHNEESVIQRCLQAILTPASSPSVEPDELEIVVACNGCTDGTARLAAAVGPTVRVLETSEASKAVAIRMADAELTSFPRVYLDADVELPNMSLAAMLDALSRPGALAARPSIVYDTSRSTAPVRAYYRARARVPAVMGSLWGAGVYGLSAEGRGRFGDYPDVVAEDLWVDQHFTADEIAIVDGPPVVVRVPRTASDLVSVLRRTYRGNNENRGMQGAVDVESPGSGSGGSTSTVLAEVVRSSLGGPSAAVDAATYLGVALAARAAGSLRPATNWERDESSRSA